MSRILVTGGAGFIGSHLVDRLVSDPSNQIVVLDNLRRGRIANLKRLLDHITFVNGDIRNRETVENIMRDVDVVYHLAAQSNVLGSVTDIDYSFSTNVEGTFEVLRAAAAAGAARLVFTSSREVYGDPTDLPVPETAPLNPKNAYGASKAAGEMYCRVFNSRSMQVRIVRLANVYGSRDYDRVIPIFASQSLQNKPLTLFGGHQVIDFVAIDHVVEALIRSANADSLPGPINIGTGKPTALRELALSMILTSGSASEVMIAPSRDAEVTKFTADITLQKSHLGLEGPADPLSHLPEVLDYFRNTLSPGSQADAAVN